MMLYPNQNNDTTLRLLVVDDDDVDRMQLKRALAATGFKHTLAERSLLCGPDDLEVLKDFDCVFLDYLLPGDNGLTLIKKIRDHGIKTPVVITTSQGNESIAVALMKAGASDYIVKNHITGTSLAKVLVNVLAMREIVREREEAAKALCISESRLAQAQRIAKIGSWEYEVPTETFYFSDEAYKVTGLPQQIPVTVDAFVSCLHPDDRTRAVEAWMETLSGKALNIDIRIMTPHGIRFANSQGQSITDASGKLEKVIGTLQDITERKLAEQEISTARQVAENSIKVREVFLANMSHEIRTPMNAILGFTSLLLQSDLTEEQRRYIDAIHFSGENLLVVINDILDVSKIRSGKLSIEKCDFDLHDLVANVISMMAPKAREKHLDLNHTIDDDIPHQIQGDPVRLNQILTNLISNAIKFTERGHVSLSISSHTSEEHGILIEFNVTDTGIGIPENMLSAIFDNFVQASDDTTRKFGGTGLGLTIVKSLVELQDGNISVTSQPGAGANFKVQIPFQHADASKVATPRQPLHQHNTTEALKGTSVLVAEDNNVNQLLIRKVLEKAGCDITIASNGMEAVEQLTEKPYDIVLMDIQMPEMNGYEATRKIRTELPKPLSEVPIIAMTAHAFGSDVSKCISAGMNDYISKPFKAPELYAKILGYVASGRHKKFVIHPSLAIPEDIDLGTFHALGSNDPKFLEELRMVYERQTPAFVEKLKSFAKNQNYEAIKSICHQIKSSYGILKTTQLEKVLQELSSLLEGKKSASTVLVLNNLVGMLITLITAINDQVQRGLKKAG